MIRREVNSDAGPAWILIPQIEHAHAARTLADDWGGDGFAPLWPREELLWAIEHHDDGWAEWDASPGLDPQCGRPRSFIEMELDDSLTIWSRSIDAARRAGPLQAYLVAGHFTVLARRVTSWRPSDGEQANVRQFLTTYEASMADWLRNWQSANPAANTPERAAVALAQLQFFDFLSLWFCCSAATEPDDVETPSGPAMIVTPIEEDQVAFWPWPLTVSQLNLEVRGQLLPAARFGSRAAFSEAAKESVQLRWCVLPGPAKS